MAFMVESGDAAPSGAVQSVIQESCDGLTKHLAEWRAPETHVLPVVNATLKVQGRFTAVKHGRSEDCGRSSRRRLPTVVVRSIDCGTGVLTVKSVLSILLSWRGPEGEFTVCQSVVVS